LRSKITQLERSWLLSTRIVKDGMQSKVLIGAEGIYGVLVEEAGFVNRTVSETLNKAVLFFRNGAVEDAHLPIVSASEHTIRVATMKVERGDVVVVLRILPLSSRWLTKVPERGQSVPAWRVDVVA
jgi:hypothetical protein